MNIGSSYIFAVVFFVCPFLLQAMLLALAAVFGTYLAAGSRNNLILKDTVCMQVLAIKRRYHACFARAELPPSFMQDVVLCDCCFDSLD